uniref:Uncharacterized protein n=1 Tax=Chenopodium quinoa TaxID=63459 RepID=A0A803N8E6_CHEQI
MESPLRLRLSRGKEKIWKWVKSSCPSKCSASPSDIPPTITSPGFGGSPSRATSRAMNVSAWNCRGLGMADSPKVPYVVSLVRSFGVDMMFLMENLVSVDVAVKKLASVSFDGFCGCDAVGLSGGFILRCISSSPFPDHAAIILKESGLTCTRRRPYKIENWCLGIKEITDIIGSDWLKSHSGSFMFSISRKLEEVKGHMFRWCATNKRK